LGRTTRGWEDNIKIVLKERACEVVYCTHLIQYMSSDGVLMIVSFTVIYVGLGGVVVSVLTIGPKVLGFKHGRGQWIFNGD
jgi:hypothetical protein